MTGGQYSILRALLGFLVCCNFVVDLVYGSLGWGFIQPESLVVILSVTGILASVAFIVGYRDRVAAVVLLLLSLPLVVRAFQDGALFELVLPWLLIQHVLTPQAPFGSWDARDRADPAGSWHYPQWLLPISWSVAGVALIVAALSLVSILPLEAYVLFTLFVLSVVVCIPFYFWKRARALGWFLMVISAITIVALGGNSQISMLLVLFLFLIEPAWLPAEKANAQEVIFFDGGCALCHGFVRFVLAENPSQSAFIFSPLAGTNFTTLIAADLQKTFPESVVVLTDKNTTLVKSNAVLHVGRRSGGIWKAATLVVSIVPRIIRDLVYDLIAKSRYYVFGRKKDVCPLMPASLRKYFVE